MLKIAIVTSAQYRSPRVLAECLNQMLKSTKTYSRVYLNLSVFKRLLTYENVKHKHHFILWFGYKLLYYLKDSYFLYRLKKYSAIVICDCSPTAFLPDAYDIEKLRIITGNIPVLLYEVYYLGNAPSQMIKLKQLGAKQIERYDWHLAITDVTEIRQKPVSPWSQIGIFLKCTGLKPVTKNGFMAVVDFLQPGFQDVQNMQISVLKELNIPYIVLKGSYTFSEIRRIYMNATFYFAQSPEAFGLPIAECLSCGNIIFTPDSSWPMSWRLDENPKVHGPGKLPECFIIYDGVEDLKCKLKEIKSEYVLNKTPQKIFDIFYKHYPTFYNGNSKALDDIMNKIETNSLC